MVCRTPRGLSRAFLPPSPSPPRDVPSSPPEARGCNRDTSLLLAPRPTHTLRPRGFSRVGFKEVDRISTDTLKGRSGVLLPEGFVKPRSRSPRASFSSLPDTESPPNPVLGRYGSRVPFSTSTTPPVPGESSTDPSRLADTHDMSTSTGTRVGSPLTPDSNSGTRPTVHPVYRVSTQLDFSYGERSTMFVRHIRPLVDTPIRLINFGVSVRRDGWNQVCWVPWDLSRGP